MANQQQDKARFATVDVIHEHDGKFRTIQTVWVSELEWRTINFVDYIEVDESGNLSSDFDIYGEAFKIGAQVVLNRAANYTV